MANNKFSRHFNALDLLKYTLPSMCMLFFISAYQMVDGIFVSNFIDELALSALNVVYPIQSLIVGFAIMLATGGSALIAKKMGEQKMAEARNNFTFFCLFGFLFGIAFAAFFIPNLDFFLSKLGAVDSIWDYAKTFLQTILFFTPMSIMQMLMQNYMITAGKPKLGLGLSIIGGLTNLILDYIFLRYTSLGMFGVALATGLGYSVSAIGGMLYFTLNRKASLYFTKPISNLNCLLQALGNGSSEMVTNLAISISTLYFNILTLQYIGTNGVAAISIILYAQFFLMAIIFGYSSGVSPIISYNYGEQNHKELKSLFNLSFKYIIGFSIFIFAISYLLDDFIIQIFTPKGSDVYQVAAHGIRLFAVSFIFSGLNIFASSLFTALSDGKTSAIISFLRTFLFQMGALFILPQLFGADGIWLAVPVAELLTLAVSIYYLTKYIPTYLKTK